MRDACNDENLELSFDANETNFVAILSEWSCPSLYFLTIVIKSLSS